MLKTPRDYKEEVLALSHREKQIVRFDGDIIKIDIGAANPYEIHINQVGSERRILEWALHLSHKKGAELLTVRVFIAKMLAHIDTIGSARTP